MKIILAGLFAVATVTFGAGVAHADGTSAIENSIANDPGLRQKCVFNAAFNSMHKGACADYSVESEASNGGYEP